MSYNRFLRRNHLEGDYPDLQAGDLRRMERDQQDARHLMAYARRTGVPIKDIAAVLQTFFADDCVEFH